MADRILLKAMGDEETVSAFNHAYPVRDGAVLVDVTPYRQDEPTADAARDAEEICRIVVWEDFGGQRQLARKFRPATKDEVASWQDKQSKAAKGN